MSGNTPSTATAAVPPAAANLAESALIFNNIEQATWTAAVKERLEELKETRESYPTCHFVCIAIFIARQSPAGQNLDILQDFVQHRIDATTNNLITTLDPAKREFAIATGSSGRLQDCHLRTSVPHFNNNQVTRFRLGHYDGLGAQVVMELTVYTQAENERDLSTWLESLRVRLMGDGWVDEIGILEVVFT